MKCPKCRLKNREEAKFCKKCGTKLELLCPTCGHPYQTECLFCDERGHRLSELAETEKPSPWFAGERKHVTVLFSDLSGYTAMCERLDPEEAKEIMSRIFGDIAQVVTKYEGFIEKFIGDAVMAIFGVPKSHEDDPVRAIRAAREIHKLVEAMNPKLKNRIGKPLSMHTGINTGLVVTGKVDLDEGTHGVAGDTVNLTARLCSLAKAGEILVGENTHLQSLSSFTFEELEPTKIKGKAESIRIYKVLSTKDEPRKIHRIHGLRAKLIGRKLEMAHLKEVVGKLRRGESSVLSILGDSGTGKSRLVEEFKASLDLEEIQWREGNAYAYSQNIPYSPLIDMLNRAFLIEEGDPPETVKEKVESSVEYLIGKKDDVIPYIGSLYALSYPEIEGVTPEFWKIRLHRAIHEILSALAQRAPTIICLEDLHWADPSSLDLLRFILSEFSHPVLFLFAYRPHFTLFTSHQLNISDKSYEEIHLKDLSHSEAREMTESLLKTQTIPPGLQRFVEERVEGNPFYLEEVINSLIESETLVRENGTWKLARSISESKISPTIHGVISGRLDRLEKETKRILQEASVIGRAFLYEILKRITNLKDNIDPCLSRLEGLDLIRTKSVQPELEYIFKHALTQEVVYEGLLKKDRRKIHERIGLVIENMFQDRISEFYEALAFHFKQGRSILKAVDYLMKSGEKSLKRYAVEESHQYYKEAFDLLTKKPIKTNREQEIIIDILNKWSVVFYYRGDFRGQQHILEAHVKTAEHLDDKARLGMYYIWLGGALENRGRIADAYKYLCRALEIGDETKDQYVIGYACAWLTWTCTHLALLDKAIACGVRAQKIASIFESDQYLHYKSLGGIGFAHWGKGDSRRALDVGKALLDYGQEHFNFRSQSLGYWITGMGHAAGGNFTKTIECCQKAVQVTKDPYYSHLPKTILGLSYVMIGQFQEAERLLEETAAFSHNMGCDEVKVQASSLLALISIAKGYMKSGLMTIEAIQHKWLKNENRLLYVISEHIIGKVYLQMVEGPMPSLSVILKNMSFLIRNFPFASRKAEYHLNKAIGAAKEIGAKGFQAQAYLDLGLLHKAKGRMDKARECISTSIELFEQGEAEGFLKQAKEALASLE